MLKSRETEAAVKFAEMLYLSEFPVEDVKFSVTESCFDQGRVQTTNL